MIVESIKADLYLQAFENVAFVKKIMAEQFSQHLTSICLISHNGYMPKSSNLPISRIF